MRLIDKIYIGGEFVTPHGSELSDLTNPTTGEVIGRVRLGDVEDARRAIAAAKRAFPAFSQTSIAERIAMLTRLSEAILKRADVLAQAATEEYGTPISRATWSVQHAASGFTDAIKTIEAYQFRRTVGVSEVIMRPLGVAALIMPWNSNYGFICSKLSMAIAAGCTSVLKPSELSAIQTQLITECLDEAELPPGAFNVVNGLGATVGAELTTHPDIAMISFTGSTGVGKAILRAAADTMKRVTLELGGKGPTIILDDADLAKAVPLAINNGFVNSGQACLAGTRILVPEMLMPKALEFIKKEVEAVKVGDPMKPDTRIGPMVSQSQYDRVQSYIHLGAQEGAKVLVGGAGKPAGLERGFFVKPTVFHDVRNSMRVAREEIFGPVLCVIPYRDDEDAIAIANDSAFGLQSYIVSDDQERAHSVAMRLETGRVVINGAPHDPLAPFGGFKESGMGREYGVFGLDAFVEPQAILAPPAAA